MKSRGMEHGGVTERELHAAGAELVALEDQHGTTLSVYKVDSSGYLAFDPHRGWAPLKYCTMSIKRGEYFRMQPNDQSEAYFSYHPADLIRVRRLVDDEVGLVKRTSLRLCVPESALSSYTPPRGLIS